MLTLDSLRSDEPLTLANIQPGARPWLLAQWLTDSDGRILYVTTDDAAMAGIADAVRYFAPTVEVLEFPAWDCLPYDRASPSLRISAQRLATLAAMRRREGPQLVLTTANAILQRVLRPDRIAKLVATMRPGEDYPTEELIARLYANGFVRVDTVADQGEFAARGDILDLFPPGHDLPLRLDFFGDELETIRRFDPADQRTVDQVEELTLLPASEALLDEDSIRRFRTHYRDRFGATATGDPLYQSVSEGRRQSGMEHWLPLIEDGLATLTDYLDAGDIMLRDAASDGAIAGQIDAIADYHANRKRADEEQSASYRPLPPELLYLDAAEWAATLRDRRAHEVTPFDLPESDAVIALPIAATRDFTPERGRGDDVHAALATHLRTLHKQGKQTIIASYSKGSRARLFDQLRDRDVALTLAESWEEAQAAPTTALTVVPLATGFRTENFALLTEQDILGDRLIRRARKRKSADAFLAELATLEQGDLVVHVDHGIGQYQGLTSIPVGESPHDCVALEYAGGDKLYVPVENIDVLSRYGEGDSVTLDRLGGEGWQRRKAKLKDRIREIAHELMRTAAARALQAGEAVEAESGDMNAFVDRFPYQETDDQEVAIAEVLDDLASGKPMDRLVCGDVGFGKTEVAMRAAFATAMAGKQVAVIAPTTLLARQHYSNFVERFRPFPIAIGRLSRLVPAGEAKQVKEGLANGKIDLVIGTHALLAKSIDFANLGLVIVDEEQRFGVTHKERLKALRTNVHMLTLTATPIPRTLQMAMTGLRELSVIQTPPVDRLAVRTYVMPWDPIPLREALLREHYRGGQSFIVVPRIADLPEIEEFLTKQVGEVSYVVAHGQMAASQVEERMSAYYDKKFDVLVSTTIVESGLDIPSANTLIVHRADRFGLAQLYQLRGRVGRSKTRAYAYLVTPADTVVTETAQKRLKILSDLDSLGAGFELASHDLDIRGAGNLLGDEQSGHIREVGFELYQSMLEDAIIEAKAKKGGLEAAQTGFSPQITVDAPILIPESYVPDLSLRMALYRRLNNFDDHDQIEAFAAELIDRFGKLPSETENLLNLMHIKRNCVIACIAKLEMGPRGALVTFRDDSFPNVPGLLNYVERLQGTAKLRPDQKLFIERKWRDPKSRMNGLKQLTNGLSKVARAGK